MFVAWFISFIWITRHIWNPKSPRLASTEQIFGTPYFDAIFIDQSLMLNRRKDGMRALTVDDLDDLDEDKADYALSHMPGVITPVDSKASDTITR